MREGRQILAHCNGDAAAQQYLQAVARAMGELDDAPDIRPVMIHAPVSYTHLDVYKRQLLILAESKQ